MEEKLYFKPAKYSKGIKKQREKMEKEDKGKKDHCVRNFVFFLVFIMVVTLTILWLLRGKTTTTGEYPSPIETKSLSCEKSGAYPKITSAISSDSSVSIVAVFDGTTSLRSLSLNYNLSYGTEAEVNAAEAKTHFEFGEGLAKQGLDFTEFNNKFSKLENRLMISLYGRQNDLSDVTRASYFMIDVSKQGIPKTISDYKTIYETQGFKCVSSGKKQ